MNFEDIIWDIKHILGALKPGSRVLTSLLMNKINNYRSIRIIEKFYSTGIVDMSWVQSTGKLITTTVSSADDPEITLTSIEFSKCTIPNVIPLPNDAGEYRITGSSGQEKIYRTNPDNLYLKITGDSPDLKMFHYYYRYENSIFVYPKIDEIMAALVQEDPMESKVVHSEYINSGNLIINTWYKVASGTIRYGIINYVEGRTFQCLIGDGVEFSGEGKVILETQSFDRKLIHNYPITRDIAQLCVLDVLQKEYQIELNLIQDVINDDQDQLKLIKSQQ